MGCYEHLSKRFVYLKEETSWLSVHQLSTKTALHRVSSLMIICLPEAWNNFYNIQSL